MSSTPQTPRSVEQDRLESFSRWLKANERAATVVLVVVALAAVGVWFFVTAQQRKEDFAQRELLQARASVEAGNLPLASSDLSRIVGSFGGTAAGEEARLLLAEVRLRQGQAALAATELQAFVDAGPRPAFRPQAYEMLGVALEETGQMGPAGQAYERGADAADAAEYKYLSLSLLLSASRAYVAAGDTAAAVRVLERVVEDHGETAGGSEAELRLAELGRFES